MPWSLVLLVLPFVRMRKIFSPLVLVVSASAVWMLLGRWGNLGLMDRLSLRFSASYALASFCVLGLLLNERRLCQKILTGLTWCVPLVSSFIIVRVAMGTDPFYAMVIANMSMVSCTLACLLPEVKKLGPLLYGISIVGVLVSGSSVGIGLLAVHVFFRYWWLALLPICIGYCLVGSDFFSSSGRVVLWEHLLKSDFNWLVGEGLGSSAVFIPKLQMSQCYLKYNTTETTPVIEACIKHISIMYNVHNDWLQILYELGAIGLICSLGVYFYTLYHAKDRSQVILFGTFMLLNWPLHWGISALLGVCVLNTQLPLDRQEETGQ